MGDAVHLQVALPSEGLATVLTLKVLGTSVDQCMFGEIAPPGKLLLALWTFDVLDAGVGEEVQVQVALAAELSLTLLTVIPLDATVGEGVPGQRSLVVEHLSAVMTHEVLGQLLLGNVHGYVCCSLHTGQSSPALFAVPQFMLCVDKDGGDGVLLRLDLDDGLN